VKGIEAAAKMRLAFIYRFMAMIDEGNLSSGSILKRQDAKFAGDATVHFARVPGGAEPSVAISVNRAFMSLSAAVGGR
jgi:hypothetical protein